MRRIDSRVNVSVTVSAPFAKRIESFLYVFITGYHRTRMKVEKINLIRYESVSLRNFARLRGFPWLVFSGLTTICWYAWMFLRHFSRHSQTRQKERRN